MPPFTFLLFTVLTINSRSSRKNLAMNPLFTSQQCTDFIRRSLQEDIGSGDHSSLAAIPQGTQGKARLLLKEDGVIAGLELGIAIFKEVDPGLKVELRLKDGNKVKKGDVGLTVEGSVHSILKSERLVLNCMQRMSGIATITNKIVSTLEGLHTRILDTRKTTPGMRFLEKYAVKVGGGYNHRIGLYDMIMLKDNHVDYAGGITAAVERTKKYLAEKSLDLKIEVETRNIQEVNEVLQAGGVHRVMFDNFSPELMKEAVKLVDGRLETEASGGITIENVRGYAETGVDFISIGALTHSVKSLDISLKEYK
jgi:nicotinate-nucleotide pyrophosphorylase (carboxylating)